jgi:hypothetical protein
MVADQVRFTGDEDRALQEMLGAKTKKRWAHIAQALHERGFPLRTGKSIRNHHYRVGKAARGSADCKNFCRRCGLAQRGHVCLVTASLPA